MERISCTPDSCLALARLLGSGGYQRLPDRNSRLWKLLHSHTAYATR
jgi:hypothetical protein